MTYAIRETNSSGAGATVARKRALRGKRNYLAGVAAEDQVAANYERRGFSVVARRWRGRTGEIDLVLRDEGSLIFVEVKKSHNFATAMAALTPAQIHRIAKTATEFVAGEPTGLMTDMRLDVALVNAEGQIDIIENVLVD